MDYPPHQYYQTDPYNHDLSPAGKVRLRRFIKYSVLTIVLLCSIIAGLSCYFIYQFFTSEEVVMVKNAAKDTAHATAAKMEADARELRKRQENSQTSNVNSENQTSAESTKSQDAELNTTLVKEGAGIIKTIIKHSD